MKLSDVNYYLNYHKHTSLSHRYNKDSPLVPKDYFKADLPLAKNGVTTIYSTVEHGWQGNYFKIYDDLEKFNKQHESEDGYKPIKFVFGTEAYWVRNRFEKDSSNCHIVLLAKNENGRRKLNRAIYESFYSGYYFKNRMDLDILLSLPKDDIFVTTACVQFWKYDDIDTIVKRLNDHFTDFYLEVQPHHTESQRKLNKHILELHNRYNIPLIAGTDSHVIKESQMADREDLLRSNKISYDDEEGWFMDYPTIEVLKQRFIEQGVLSEEEIAEALCNTHKIEFFDDIVLNRDLKVPVPLKYRNFTQEERNEILKDIIRKEWNQQKYDINKDKLAEYKKEIQYNTNEIIGCGMTDYFLMNYEVMKLGQTKEYGGILTPSGRGSGVSFFLNKLLGFTKVDKVNSDVVMYAERFLTKERILESHTAPDIDHNVSDREPFKRAQEAVLGTQSFDLLALGTLHYKSAFKMYSRAYNLDPVIANNVTKQIDKYEQELKYAEDDEKDDIDIFDFVEEKYRHLIIGCQQYMDIVDTVKAHPCGCLALSDDVIENVGVIMVKAESQGEKAKETFVALLESSVIDSFGYLKQDYLIVDSIGLIYDIYKALNMKPLTVNQLLDKIRNDKPTWDIYKNGLTMCINQVEKQKSTEKAMKYKPQNISELTQFIAAIRPSFQTMLQKFLNREHFEYGIKALDDILQDEFCSSSFILYQESLMKVLGFAGFPMKDTYTIIKAISKKKKYVIDGAKEKFIPNFAKAILDTGETSDPNKANELAGEVWKIIENSAAYGFNCLSGDTRLFGYNKTIAELYEQHKDDGLFGFGLSLDGNKCELNKIIDIYKQPRDMTYIITLENGKSIKATFNHKFPMIDGTEKTVSELKVGIDCLLCKNKNYEVYESKIISIEENEIEDVYDVSMSGDVSHTFVIDNGIVTSNCSHAYCMAIDSVTLAWLKAHYPLQFYQVCLERYTKKKNKDKVSSLKREALRMGIKLKPIKFGDDNRKFSIDENEPNTINQTMGSIKNMQGIVPEIMYELGQHEYKDIFCLFRDIKKTPINKKSLDYLIKLDYFKEFGNSNYVNSMLKTYEELMVIADKFRTGKTLKKDYVNELGITEDEMLECCQATAKMFKNIDNEKAYKIFLKHYKDICSNILLKYPYTEPTIYDKVKSEVKILGYTDITIPNSRYFVVQNVDINNYGTPFIEIYCLASGNTKIYKVAKKWWNDYPLEQGDIIEIVLDEKNKWKQIDGQLKKIDETEIVLSLYTKI